MKVQVNMLLQHLETWLHIGNDSVNLSTAADFKYDSGLGLNLFECLFFFSSCYIFKECRMQNNVIVHNRKDSHSAFAQHIGYQDTIWSKASVNSCHANKNGTQKHDTNSNGQNLLTAALARGWITVWLNNHHMLHE